MKRVERVTEQMFQNQGPALRSDRFYFRGGIHGPMARAEKDSAESARFAAMQHGPGGEGDRGWFRGFPPNFLEPLTWGVSQITELHVLPTSAFANFPWGLAIQVCLHQIERLWDPPEGKVNCI